MKLKYFLSLSFFFLLLSFSFSEATVRYVSKTGTSTPPYTSWQTAADSIQKCINICSFGDTVYVANGVYKERIDMIPGLSLIGAGMDSCVIDTREIVMNGFRSLEIKDSCYLSGFFIYVAEEDIGTGVYTSTGLNTIIEKNKIVNGNIGIRINSNSQIKFNIIINNYLGDGVISYFNNPIIDSNFFSIKFNAIGLGLNSNPVIRGNDIFLTHSSADGIGGGFNLGATILNNNIYCYSSQEGIYAISGEQIANNIIYGNFELGIWTSSSSQVLNNTITNGGVGIRSEGGMQLSGFRYNNVWANQNNYYNFIPDSSNISVDPMFFNEDSLDFHLQKYSPLVDAGDPNILDKDSSRSDIGIYGGPYGESYKYLDLAPRAPINLTALLDSNYITLNWNRNTESDTSFYNVYRDTVINFTIDSTKLVSSPPNTFFVQTNPHNVSKYVYKVTCIDKQGNESQPSEEVVVIITSVSVDDYPMTISDFRLYQNYPNPFNPSTTISYRLKERGYVKLYVYDIKGELVSVLVNKTQDAGFYQVDFSSSSIQHQESSIQNLASGIYIYQIHVIGENNIPVYTDIKKMILLK